MLTSAEIHPDNKGSSKSTQELNEIGKVYHAVKTENGCIFYGENANFTILFVSGNVFRLKLFFGEAVDLRTTPAIVKQEQEITNLSLDENDHAFEVATELLRVVILKDRGQIQAFNSDNELFFNHKEWYWNSKDRFLFSMTSTDDSHFYGVGEQTGFLDKKGGTYEMWNTDVYAPHVPDTGALYQSIPYVIHFQQGKPAYGILLDNPGKTVLNLSQSEEFSFHTETGELDLYICYGPTLKGLMVNYTSLVGRIPMPPQWAIGYQQSRYSYMNQKEVLEIARSFREKQIPCDVIYLDIHYMDEYRVFTFDKSRFPNPKEMLDELRELGFYIVPIVDPGVKKDPKYKVYQEGVEKDLFSKKLEGDLFIGEVWPGPSAFPDFTNDETAKWWGEKHSFYTELGIQGIWNDMNEPSVFNTESKTMDVDVVHKNNGNLKTHGEWHNLYGMLMSKATYEGLKDLLDGKRPFVLTRAGYTGIQRYATVWTGDNRSYWEHMEMSIAMVLNLGLSGIPFSGPDVGGFSHNTSGELVARWTQMGAFFPFFRNHSAIDTIRQEPWLFGEVVEAVCRDYISLRYRLMPYFYSLFYEASKSGLPIVRPMVLEYPQDPEVYNMSDQFLVGSDILVAPILRPGSKSRSVYLPEGVWFDYWTGEKQTGGRYILAHAPLHVIPIYIKAGAIIPEQPQKQFATDEVDGAITYQVYAGEVGKSRVRLYKDDGQTFEYERGSYLYYQFDLEVSLGQATVISEVLHNGLVSDDEESILLVKHLPFKPTQVDGLNELEGWTYDSVLHELSIKLHSVVRKPILIK